MEEIQKGLKLRFGQWMKIDIIQDKEMIFKVQMLQIASMKGHSYFGSSSSLLSPNIKQLEFIWKVRGEKNHF